MTKRPVCLCSAVVYKQQTVVVIASLKLPGTEMRQIMDKCLKAMLVMLLAAPLALAFPATTEEPPTSEEDEGFVSLLGLVVNNTDAENGTVRVFLNPGYGLYPQQYPFSQQGGFVNFPNNPSYQGTGYYPGSGYQGTGYYPGSGYQGTGYYPGSGLYPYLQDCTYWCPRPGYNGEVYCCTQ
nr:pupal cuticle protein Edg-91-like [Penaeus vannamei]